MDEEHLGFLAARLSLWIELRGRALAGKLPDLLEPLAGDGTCIDLRTAPLLCRADAANHLAGAVFAAACSRLLVAWVLVVLPSALQLFAFGTKIPVIVGIPGEVGPRPRSILAFRFVKDRDERQDLSIQREPGEVLFRAVGGVSRNPVRLQPEAFAGPVDHAA